MQFGKWHGIALLVLGLFLLVAQVWISFDQQASNSQEPVAVQAPDNGSTRDHESLVRFLAGGLGILCVLGGGVLFIKERHQPADVPVHPIR